MPSFFKVIPIENTWIDMKVKKEEDNSNIATIVDYDVASFLSCSKSICNFGIGISRIRGPLMTTTFF